MSYEYSVAAIVAAHTAFLALIDAGAGASTLTIHNNADALLGTITLSDPAGTINAGTGRLTITAAAGAYNASATGTAATAKLRDGDGTVHLTLLCIQSATPEPGYCVLNSLSLVSGTPIELTSMMIG